jgi:hypothetical protein
LKKKTEYAVWTKKKKRTVKSGRKKNSASAEK